MEVDNVPSEVWEQILHNVDQTKELKNVSLVCQSFNGIVKEQLWNAPKLKSGMTVEDLLALKHLPIKHIDTGNFGKLVSDSNRRGDTTQRWMDAICSFTQLTSLKLGWNIHLTHCFIGKLVALKNLKSLTLEKLYAGISKALTQIECLQLQCFRIEDLIFNSDVEPISKSVSKIQMLEVLEIQTNDGGARYLSKLHNLKELIINESQLTQYAFTELAKLKSLKKIKFNYCEDVREHKNILKTANPQLIIEVEGEEMNGDDYDDYDNMYDDYDPNYEEDLPPDFFDNYNELNLDDSGYNP